MFQDKEFGEFHYLFLLTRKQMKFLVDDEVFENIAKIYEKEGSDCWFSDDPQKFLGKNIKLRILKS